MTGNKNSLEISQKLFGFSLMKEAVRNEDDTANCLAWRCRYWGCGKIPQ